MATQAMASEFPGKHFLTAVLLTGNVQRAEAAVLESIGSMDLDQTAASAIRADQFPGRSHRVAPLLPAELKRVLQLAPDLRRYFVLRMLIGMPRERCAALLKVDSVQVDQGTRMAMTELARIAESNYVGFPCPSFDLFGLTTAPASITDPVA
jgi:hypothetical protein